MITAETWLSVLFILVGGILVYTIGGKVLSVVTKQIVRGHLRNSPKKDIQKRQETLASLIAGIWRIIVAATIVVSILPKIFTDIDLAPLFTSAGIIGIAVAFGSQALVKDFLTGVFIVTENQYRVGDYVTINDADGRVEHIGSRSTVIRDDNGNVHYLPNGSIVHVVNKTMGYSKVHFSILLTANSDLDNAISVINQVGDRLADSEKWKSKILSAPQFSSVGAFTGSSIEVTITGKTLPSDQWAITAEMRRRLIVAFEKNDIKLA